MCKIKREKKYCLISSLYNMRIFTASIMRHKCHEYYHIYPKQKLNEYVSLEDYQLSAPEIINLSIKLH